MARRLRSSEIIDVLADLMLERGAPEHIRSDNGAELIALRVRDWIAAVPRPPTSSRAVPGRTATSRAYEKLRDELFNTEIFYSLKEAQVLIGAWRRHYNAVRPHGSLR